MTILVFTTLKWRTQSLLLIKILVYHFTKKGITMSNIKEVLAKLLTTDGAMAAAVVDSGSGLMLGGDGSGIDLELAAAGNTEVVRAKLKTMNSLNLKESIDDILITLENQYHIIKLSNTSPGLFIYYVLDKAKANLALARRSATDAMQNLSI